MPSDRRPRIAYAQNFLRSRRLVDALLDAADLGPDDLVVEIGPGTGVVTASLARRCRQVLAIEKDPRLARGLRGRLAGAANVAVFEADALAFPLPVSPYRVFANIPFNATAAIVARVTTEPFAPRDAHLVVQREAAERFLGEPRGTLAGLLLHPWFEPTVVHRFRRSDFLPAPRVDVVMLRLKKRGPPRVADADAQAFRDFAVALFTAWRPTVRDALIATLGDETARRVERRSGVDLRRSPVAVGFGEWLAAFAALLAVADEPARRAIAGAEARLRAEQAGLQKRHRTRASGRA